MLLGSSFTHRHDPPTDSDRLAPVEHARFEAKGLLIVDDEPGIRSALVRMLRRDGYRILTAESGEAGLQLLATTAVQVIISDQRMPGMVGTEDLASFLVFAFGVVLKAGHVVQLVSLPLALLAMYRLSSLRSGFPTIVLAISCLHVAIGSFYFY